MTDNHAGRKTYEYSVEFTDAGVVAVRTNVVWQPTVERFFDEVQPVRADCG